MNFRIKNITVSFNRNIVLSVVVCLLSMYPAIARGADFTGHWSGTRTQDNYEGYNAPLTCDLSQSGSDITGTFSTVDQDCGTISNVNLTGSANGSIANLTGTFYCSPYGVNVTLSFANAVLSGNDISGSYTSYDGADTHNGTFSQTRQYQLTVNKAGNGSGSVQSDPQGITYCSSTCSNYFDADSQVILYPQPNSGTTFTGWSGGGCSGTGNCTVTMDSAKNVTATFTLNAAQYTLTVTKSGSGGGTISVDNGTLVWSGNTGTASYSANTQVNISASADSGSFFVGWSGACGGNATPCQLTMSSSKSVSATFNSLVDFSASPTSGTVPFIVSFTDASINAPTTWLWDFGDGRTGAEQNPVHAYKEFGVYNVSLTATGTSGSVTKTKNNYIFASGCFNPQFKIGSSMQSFPSIGNAYDSMSSGDVLDIQGLDFTEDTLLQRPVDITIEGGYNCEFTSDAGATTIRGSLTIGDGTASVGNLVIQ